MSRLEKTYHESIRPQLMKDLSITNIWAVPRMTKVVVNMGEWPCVLRTCWHRYLRYSSMSREYPIVP